MDIISIALLVFYFSILVLLSLYGIHRYFIVYLFYKYYKNKRRIKAEAVEIEHFPTVTVQLPIYNEKYVVTRLIEAVGQLEYPRDRLNIQVLDDSTDQTQEISLAAVHRLKEEGFSIQFMHRAIRKGYKAGALQEGLSVSSADLIAIFDADFLPDPDFLLKVVPYFTDPQISMVQTRWGYLNREYSLLTRIQALLLDGHFVLEHTARYFSGRFFNFNGTAGVWRRQAILDAGGWQGDTLTEDLDLSYRAQLAGAQFVFLPHVVCLSELPVTITGFKQQQFRWAKGAIQVARKLLPTLWKSSLPLSVKLEATVHLTSNVCYVLLAVLSLLLPLSVFIRHSLTDWNMKWLELLVFIFTVLSISIFYLVSQRELYPDWRWKLRDLPILFGLGIGICLNNSRAVLDVIFARETPFERTPKYGIKQINDKWRNKLYGSNDGKYAIGEFFLLFYLLFFLILFVLNEFWLSLPFFLLFLIGYAFVCTLTLKQTVR
ncbi:cellulose synthase family protein [candidate division CSSED10-310 bacterium]|uniref:Cellulose synthase family protein n=1 Tax=candidate division CSSED10-310 bacterium TaxID=2855610 RepID=A0ABV6Z0P0_UNCC1